MIDADRGIGQVDEEHARALLGLCHHDADARALRTGDEGLAAVDYPVVAVEVAGCLHHRRVRSRPALVGGLGHKEGPTDAALDPRLQETRRLAAWNEGSDTHRSPPSCSMASLGRSEETTPELQSPTGTSPALL